MTAATPLTDVAAPEQRLCSLYLSPAEAECEFYLADKYERFRAAPSVPAFTADLGPADIQAHDIGPTRRYRYLRVSLPNDPAPPPRSDRPRVLITVGTYANASGAEVIRSAAACAVDAGAEVVAILGNSDRGNPQSFPDSISPLAWVDMPAAIRSSDLIVHHGGAGTALSTVLAGKPAIVLPQTGDQFRNSELLLRARVAETCPPGDAAALVAALQPGLTQPTSKERALGLAQKNDQLPDVSTLAGHIIEAVA